MSARFTVWCGYQFRVSPEQCAFLSLFIKICCKHTKITGCLLFFYTRKKIFVFCCKHPNLRSGRQSRTRTWNKGLEGPYDIRFHQPPTFRDCNIIRFYFAATIFFVARSAFPPSCLYITDKNPGSLFCLA